MSSNKKTIRIASIDIGTNSALLLILDVNRKRKFKIAYEAIKTPRIGANREANGKIPSANIDRLLNVLKEFKRICKARSAENIFVVATEAMRRASNKKEISKRIKKELDLKIEIISANREAQLAYLSAVFELSDTLKKKAAVLDIGGGSSELIFKRGSKMHYKSLRIGALQLREHFKLKYPLNSKKVEQIRRYANEKIKKEMPKVPHRLLLGVGGTINALSSLERKVKCYKSERLDMHRINIKHIENAIKKIQNKNISEIKKMQGIPKGREDILLPGLIILESFFKSGEFEMMLSRNRGIKFGLIFDYLKRQKFID